MHSLPAHANPFVMMTDPESILQAVQRSERLKRLSRTIYRPLDKPLIPKLSSVVAAEFDLAIEAEDADIDLV